ncbi:MAG: molybdate ABC transporter substrate-binding protein [Candidatus Limnocylindrales bacterium]
MRTRRAATFVGTVLLAVACTSAGTPTPDVPLAATTTSPAALSSDSTGSLTVYAAASLTAAFNDIKAAYQTANPGLTLSMAYGSSSALETQIEQGAPADVLASADTTNPQQLVDTGLAAGAITTFAGNLLTVIVPPANPGGVQTPADLAKANLKVIAAGDAVPITKYANQLVANLAKQPGYPPAFVAQYSANLVSKEDDVAAVTVKIALGEGDAAIVYMTDAKTAAGKVATVAVPAAANVPASYGAVVIKASANPTAAAAFVAWLAGPDGQAILARYGFLPPG